MAEDLHARGARAVAGLVGRAPHGVLDTLAHAGHRAASRLDIELEARRVDALDDAAWLEYVYASVFGREPDALGLKHWTGELRAGMSREAIRHALLNSPEARDGNAGAEALTGFHLSRVAWTRSLPPARRILDLGGTSLDSPLGSLLIMGYPYNFESLVIIDLPSEDRHEYYAVGDNADLQSDRGPVSYDYRSMVDLDDIADESVDLVVSAQTFEHITEDEGRTLLDHVARILAPGGHLALDTPNRAVTEIQCAETGLPFINPDHKIEYTQEQLLAAYARAGLKVERQHGLGYMPRTVATRTWIPSELAEHQGLYDVIEESYTLAHLVGRA